MGSSAMRFAGCLIVLGVVLMLGACREAEQNRPLFHNPGVYSGPEDEKLNERQLEELRARAQNMRGA